MQRAPSNWKLGPRLKVRVLGRREAVPWRALRRPCMPDRFFCCAHMGAGHRGSHVGAPSATQCRTAAGSPPWRGHHGLPLDLPGPLDSPGPPLGWEVGPPMMRGICRGWQWALQLDLCIGACAATRRRQRHAGHNPQHAAHVGGEGRKTSILVVQMEDLDAHLVLVNLDHVETCTRWPGAQRRARDESGRRVGRRAVGRRRSSVSVEGEAATARRRAHPRSCGPK